MSRSPNLAISAWFRQNSIWNPSWVLRAVCAVRQDLPWISDSRPTLDEYLQMCGVCNDCPVVRSCAAYAVRANGGRGVDGGFYAGVWLPWPSSGESGETKLMRSRARRRLKAMIRPREVVDA